MKFVFPQDPSSALSAMRRVDENADVQSGQSDRARKQDLAVVGQTVPLIFCLRKSWGEDIAGQSLGTNGGVWYSPRLIGLYPKQLDVNLLFLLSQGEIKNIAIEDVYYGYAKLEDMVYDEYVLDENGNIVVDENNRPITAPNEPFFNIGYEAIPDGIDSVYQPGGSDELNIPNVRPTEEFELRGYNFTTSPNTSKLQIQIQGDLYSERNGSLVDASTYVSNNPISAQSTCTVGGSKYTATPDCEPGCIYWAGYTTVCGGKGNYGKNWANEHYVNYTITYYRISTLTPGDWASSPGPSIKVEFKTYAVYRLVIWAAEAAPGDDPIYDQKHTVRVEGGTYAFPDITLSPDTYRVVVELLEDEAGWDTSLGYYPVRNNYRQEQQAYEYEGTRQDYTVDGVSPGRGVLDNGLITVTETIYQKFEYPEVLGGGDQTTGTFYDLTLAGIKGSISGLKPVDGSGYWVQSHIFVKQGVECNRLLPSALPGGEAIGPSNLYPDLFAYLLSKMKLLQNDQIDTASLVQACKVHNRYKLFYNGVIQLTENFADFVTMLSPYFLMSPRQVDGKYGLAPVVPVRSDGEFDQRDVQNYLAASFSADDIVDGSYERSYIPHRDRKDVCLVMVYKDQPPNSPGQTVTIEVRYKGTALQGPFMQHDLTDFCCHPNQAVVSARYLLAKRRHTEHTCSMVVGRRGAQLNPGDIISVNLELFTTDGAGVNDLNYYQIESIAEGASGNVGLELTLSNAHERQW